MDSDILLVSNSHKDKEVLYLFPVVSLNWYGLSLILAFFIILFLSFLAFLSSLLALLGDSAVGLKVLNC